jgi:hypothetical protein
MEEEEEEEEEEGAQGLSVRKGNSHLSESHPRLWQALGWRTWEVLVLLATVATMKMFRSVWLGWLLISVHSLQMPSRQLVLFI